MLTGEHAVCVSVEVGVEVAVFTGVIVLVNVNVGVQSVHFFAEVGLSFLLQADTAAIIAVSKKARTKKRFTWSSR